MPLVVPSMEERNAEWTNKLVGKTVNETESNEVNFCKKELPEQHRVVKPGDFTTMDFVENRLNVHVNGEGTVTHVTHG